MVASGSRPQRNLTGKEEAFCQHVANGKTFLESFRIAYDAKGYSKGAAQVQAYRLSCKDHIAARIRELREKIEERMVLSRSRKRHILYEIAEKKSNQPHERIKAIEVDNRMTGDEAPVKVEGDVTVGLVLTALLSSTSVAEKIAEPVETETKAIEIVAGEADEQSASDEAKVVHSLMAPSSPIPSHLSESEAPAGPFDQSGDQMPVNPVLEQAKAREYEDG